MIQVEIRSEFQAPNEATRTCLEAGGGLTPTLRDACVAAAARAASPN